MDARQFVIALFREGPPPAVLRLEASVQIRGAVLTEDGVTCEGETVTGLAALPDLCRALLDAGHDDSALQVRTWRGEPVCFIASIAGVARTDEVGTPSPQLSLGFDA